MTEEQLIELYNEKDRLDILFVIKTIITPAIKKNKLTRTTTAEALNISRHTLNGYLCNGMSRMPYNVFSDLCKLLDLDKEHLIYSMNYKK